MVRARFDIRAFKAADAEKLADLFRTSILEGTVADYNDQQRTAWAKVAQDDQAWRKKCQSLSILLSEADGQLAGFIGFNPTKRYVDLLYVHPGFMRKGVATSLLSQFFKLAHHRRFTDISVDASITAKPFFERKGFKVLSRQNVQLGDVSLTNFKMVKRLK